MPITAFSNFNDGLDPAERRRDQFVTDTNLDDEKLWIPYVDGAWFQACQFNVTSGGFSNILRINPGAKLPPHYHVGSVHGYTIRGSWKYLEHDWVVYIDSVENGKVVGYDDGFTLLELARKHYRNVGLDEALLDAMIR
jgi:2,4'-dihydroxyacetophenone dioxygenase